MTNFKPYPCAIDSAAIVPAAIRAISGSALYAVAELPGGKLLVSAAPDPKGALCTAVDKTSVRRTGTAGPAGRGLSFLKPGAKVWYVDARQTDAPVAEAEVESVHEDAVVLDDPRLGSKTVGIEDVFADPVSAERRLSETVLSGGL